MAVTDDEAGDEWSESDKSLDECANEEVVDPGRLSLKEADYNVFHATFGHADRSFLKTIARSMGVVSRILAPSVSLKVAYWREASICGSPKRRRIIQIRNQGECVLS